MNEHDIVVLTRPLADHGLKAGDVGTIVHDYQTGEAYEVEFMTGNGSTIAVLTLDAADIRPVATREILHVRDVPA